MPAPLLNRMLIVEVPWPDRDGARLLAAAIAENVLKQSGLAEVVDDALAVMVQLSPRHMCRILEIACGFAAAANRLSVTEDDVRASMEIALHDRRRRGRAVLPGLDKIEGRRAVYDPVYAPQLSLVSKDQQWTEQQNSEYFNDAERLSRVVLNAIRRKLLAR